MFRNQNSSACGIVSSRSQLQTSKTPAQPKLLEVGSRRRGAGKKGEARTDRQRPHQKGQARQARQPEHRTTRHPPPPSSQAHPQGERTPQDKPSQASRWGRDPTRKNPAAGGGTSATPTAQPKGSRAEHMLHNKSQWADWQANQKAKEEARLPRRAYNNSTCANRVSRLNKYVETNSHSRLYMYVDERETGAYASQAMFRPSDQWKETDRKQAQVEDKACVWMCNLVRMALPIC